MHLDRLQDLDCCLRCKHPIRPLLEPLIAIPSLLPFLVNQSRVKNGNLDAHHQSGHHEVRRHRNDENGNGGGHVHGSRLLGGRPHHGPSHVRVQQHVRDGGGGGRCSSSQLYEEHGGHAQHGALNHVYLSNVGI